MSTDINIRGTVSIGGDLTVGNIGYGAMQLTGPRVWGEYPDPDQGVTLLREVVAEGVCRHRRRVWPALQRRTHQRGAAPLPGRPRHGIEGRLPAGGPEYSDMGATGNKWYLRQAAYMSTRRLGLDRIDLVAARVTD